MTNKTAFLRDYQKDIVARVKEAWELHHSVMVQMPTGTGKTHVLASIVADFPGKVLIVAHRVELVEQIRETILKLRIENEKLKKTAINCQKSGIINQKSEITVSSIQTISRRMGNLDFTPNLIIIDEAHHALARTYRILWEMWPEAKFLGLTATPCRMNHAGFTDLFDVLVTSDSVAEFIRKGVLSVFDYVSIRPDSAEQQLIDSLQKRGADGDYQVKEMDAVLNRQPSIERLYHSVREFADGKKGIVYAISIDHAEKIAEHYNQQGVKTVAISSKTKREERKRMVEDFKAGDIRVMVNVDVFSEGFDCPDVEFVQMARPTLSLAKYLQQVGRGLRKTRGKETCMMIDNVGLYRVFGLPVRVWNWERMFRGMQTGKGVQYSLQPREMACVREAVDVDEDEGMELLVSHETLLSKLFELSEETERKEIKGTLRAWQDGETGLWGLKKGRTVTVEADYVRVFDMQRDWAAVRFGDHSCGVVDATGKVWWKRDACMSMKFLRNRLMLVQEPDGEEKYVDLCNGQMYEWKPEVKRFGVFELLKVRHLCYSRTRDVYVSGRDFEGIYLVDKGFYLSIFEDAQRRFCLLAGDDDCFYRLCRRMADGSIVVADTENRCYHVEEGRGKRYLGSGDCLEEMDLLAKEIEANRKTVENDKRRWIMDECGKAMPFQSGIKWGLKVGNQVTIPPIYRNIQWPVGKYCAVEMNYSQWGVVAIDGTVLIEPKYPEVVIGDNGTVVLTYVTGKKETINIKK